MGRIDAGITQMGSGDRAVEWFEGQREYLDLLRMQQDGNYADLGSTTIKGWIALFAIIALIIVFLWFLKNKI